MRHPMSRPPAFTSRELSRREAFTLLELVIVILIVMVSLALFVVWLDQPKRGNEVTQTRNNLRQMGMALHLCSDTYKKLPPAWGSFGSIGPGLNRSGTAAASLHVHLLPFIEQLPLYNAILETGLEASVASSAVIWVYLAPSDPTTTSNGARIQNLAANMRVFSDAARSADPDGPAPLTTPNTCSFGIHNGFPDGTSETLLFATRYSVCSRITLDYRARPDSAAASFFAAHAPADTAKAGSTNSTAWTFQHEPTAANCNNNPSVFGHSYSRSGLSVCLADATVRFISPSISGRTWRSVVHPSDGKDPGDDWNN